MLTILGVPFSAHTRKVILAVREKGLPFELIPTIPLLPADELPAGFLEQSPLKKIPVLRDGEFAIADSSVIAQYLEAIAPEPPLFPGQPRERARALFLEELVDGDLAQHVLHGVLFQRVFGPRFLGLSTDTELVERSLAEHIPPRLRYLESALQGEWFGPSFSYADITVASMLLNYCYAGEKLDAYPKLRAHVARVSHRPALAPAFEEEASAAASIEGLDLGMLRELGY